MNAPYIHDREGQDYRDIRRCAPTAAGTLFKAIILRCIENCDDPADRKERIMIAREHGHIDDNEAAALC